MGDVPDHTPSATSRIQERLTTQLPLMWFSLAFLAGIVLGSLVSLSIWIWAALALAFLLLALLARLFPPFDTPSGRRASLSTFFFFPSTNFPTIHAALGLFLIRSSALLKSMHVRQYSLLPLS